MFSTIRNGSKTVAGSFGTGWRTVEPNVSSRLTPCARFEHHANRAVRAEELAAVLRHQGQHGQAQCLEEEAQSHYEAAEQILEEVAAAARQNAAA